MESNHSFFALQKSLDLRGLYYLFIHFIDDAEVTIRCFFHCLFENGFILLQPLYIFGVHLDCFKISIHIGNLDNIQVPLLEGRICGACAPDEKHGKQSDGKNSESHIPTPL